MKEWTTPEDVAGQLTSLWNDGRILAASLSGSPLFPFVARMRKPDAKALATRFDDVRKWIRVLEQGSKAALGFGYEVRWAERQHRQLGRNRMPAGICIETEDDALRLIEKQHDAERFRRLVSATTPRFPVLSDWLAQAPLTALGHVDDWERILAVLQWFRDHPRSGRYLRQLDIPGLDTKFIEDRKGILSLLLDRVLHPDTIERSFAGSRNFEPRYGLSSKPPLVRFRILDPRLRLGGLSDLSVPASEFSQLALGVQRVFITENETNGIAFPDVPESLVVFGLGYGVELLRACEWFRTKAVFYWGDIDTHGFAMLDRLRALFPHTRTLLMDRETLLAHRRLWVIEPTQHDKALDRLNGAERALYDELRDNRLGERVRLEQERIPFAALGAALSEVVTLPSLASGA